MVGKAGIIHPVGQCVGVDFVIYVYVGTNYLRFVLGYGRGYAVIATLTVICF